MAKFRSKRFGIIDTRKVSKSLLSELGKIGAQRSIESKKRKAAEDDFYLATTCFICLERLKIDSYQEDEDGVFTNLICECSPSDLTGKTIDVDRNQLIAMGFEQCHA